MKRYIYANTDYDNTASKLGKDFTLDDIKRELRSLREREDRVSIKNGSVMITSYERDFYTFARLNDLLDYAHRLGDKEFDIDIALHAVGESAGYHHWSEHEWMVRRVNTLKKKYFG